ncbi:MAG TPA: xanthine dehydrogenase family protein molybdopterin-binding subunit [Devosiaceae bacterium]|jgi:xanthine dehydrogenase YagR molybdenum-binding subunit
MNEIMPSRSGLVVGRDHSRIDGPLKVTGQARYTSDHHTDDLLYAVPVGATIANGRIAVIDATKARQMPGVRAIFVRGDLGPFRRIEKGAGSIDEKRPPFEDDVIRYYGQFVALAVADTFEEAKAAADAVDVTYETERPDVDPELPIEPDKTKSERGDIETGLASGEIKIDATYRIASETHNPIEMHATVASFDGDMLTIHETSQGVVNHRNVVADMLGLPRDKVRVLSEYLGSGFGGKLWPWTHSLLAPAAAMKLGRPVKCVLSRQMMFSTAGHRPRTQQRIQIAAQRNGKLTALSHDYANARSILDHYEENCGEATPILYSVPNLRVRAGTAPRNIGNPTAMRGPGAVPGLFAMESAMDELAVALDMDPVALRLMNEPELDESLGIPFSSRHLQECLQLGSERFGWSTRDPRTGSMRRDGEILGWGVAACTWIAGRWNCSVRVQLHANGTVRVSSATQDIGTGTITVMAQMAADQLGLQARDIEVALGDSALPAGPLSGGSMVTSSLVGPINEAIAEAGRTLAKAARNLFDQAPEFIEGRLVAGNRSLSFAEALQKLNLPSVQGEGHGKASKSEKPEFSMHSFGAHFVEIAWRPEIARLRVSRVVSVIDAGRIVNPIAARNQIAGAVVMGIGMALLEGTEYDERTGTPVNSNLADYMVATNADVPPIDVEFVEHPDFHINPLGVRGVGEIGLAGTAAAITNAVYHATGRRIRALPLRLEDLL